jgi:MFS family permease
MKQSESDRKDIPLTVIAIGVASFFATFSSDMIYPLLPLFLSSMLGAGALGLGLIEGVAEATASALKIVSGYLTDKTKKRKPFVVTGYSLSSLVRPLIGLANMWPSVLWLRFIDRAGHGISSSPKDALIADTTDHEFSGHAFGFQKAMDYGGSVLGPLAAVFLLKRFGFSLRSVFLFSAIPAALAMALLIFLVKEKKPRVEGAASDPSSGTDAASDPASGTGAASDTSSEEGSGQRVAESNQKISEPDQKNTGRDFRLFLLAGIVFGLGHPTDTFFLLRLNMVGVEAASSAVLWSVFNFIKTISTYAGGSISDRIGQKPMIIAGWIYYALVYLMFAHLQSKRLLIGAFLSYSLYFGLAVPATRAWIASFVPQDLMGRAFGYYSGVIGIISLPSSLLFGLLWQKWGYRYAFITGVVFALSGCILISMIKD